MKGQIMKKRALTAQNTTGVTGIMDSTPEFLAAQIDAVFTD